MSISQLKTFNTKLIRSNNDITLESYILQILEDCETKIDVAFAKLYLAIIDHEDEFFIDSSLLYKYGIIKSNEDAGIDTILQKANAVEGVDYIVDYHITFTDTDDLITDKYYILTPKIFKILLVTSIEIHNSSPNPYIEYLYILKRIECAYYKYQIQIKDMEIKKKNELVSRLTKDNKKIRNELLLSESEFREFKHMLVKRITCIKNNVIDDIITPSDAAQEL